MLLAGVPRAAGAGMQPSTVPLGQWVESVQCTKDPTQTYSLYLPSNHDDSHQWPVLMVFDPRGRSVPAGERFRRAADQFGWIIISSNDTRSDESWEPNSKALQALWPEVHSHYSIDPLRIYGAGFSGGVIIAWYLAQLADRPTLAGIIGSGGRPTEGIPVDNIEFAHFGTAGQLDFNFLEMKILDVMVANQGAPHQLQFFEGQHQWMPEELAFEGIEWMEILAMQQKLRPVDATLHAQVFQKYMKRAAALESEGHALDATRRYQLIIDTWSGLRDVRSIDKRLSRLEASDIVQQQRREELEADRWELAQKQRFIPPLGELENGSNKQSFEDIRDELELDSLHDKAESAAYAGRSAQRVLEWIYTRTSFYIHRQLIAAGKPDQAAIALRIAASIHPQRARVWYNLACAHSLAGEEKAATRALHEAINQGFNNLQHAQNDPDLANIRGSSKYQSAIARLQ